ARDPKEKEPTYRMGGLTCLAGDFMGMGDYYFETPLQIGDTILFEQKCDAFPHLVQVGVKEHTAVNCKKLEHQSFDCRLIFCRLKY
ncbi:MAG: hypothetical protein F6K26_19505, partial [Moorea sp. SIO2I5]|nr:hypothetical protein [Moorena sp. SIO2I5]